MNVSARSFRSRKEQCSADLDSAFWGAPSTHHYRDTRCKLSGSGVYDAPGAVSLPSFGAIQLKYRPDIDGLRAIAVVSVILFHAFPTLVPGGFIGVDVFFAISGFLITSLIIGNLNEEKFSAVDFYARRIKRIFPCLILVLASCLSLGWLNMLPNEFQLLGNHVFAGAGFWTNITLNNEAGYFDAAGTQKPLLHLWSLAIEEQFYLIWPLLIILAWRWGRRVLPVIVSIAIISLAVNLLRVDSHPVSTFYLLPTRAWELMAGACLVWITPGWQGIMPNHQQQIAAELTSAVGLLFVFGSIAFLDSNESFPGWRAMLPVAGTMLLISAGPYATINRVLLSHPIPVEIGLMSYPLYLWHWPALAFAQIAAIGSASNRIVSIALASMLAVATFRFVERKIRRASHSFSVILLGMMALVGGFGFSANLGSLRAASASQGFDDITAALNDYVYPANVAVPVPFDDQTFWKIGSGRESIVFLGDSNAEQYFTRVRSLAHETGQSVIFATNGGCPPILGFHSKDAPRCEAFIPAAFHFAEMSPAKTVVIAAQWFGYFSKASGAAERLRFYASIRQEVAELRSRGKAVFIVLNVPVGAAFSPTSRVTRHLFSIQLHGSRPVPETINADSKSVSDSLKRIAREMDSISIDPFEFLCSKGFCLTTDKFGHPAYKDGYHLRAGFVRNSASFIDQVFSKADESHDPASRIAHIGKGKGETASQ
jgi:peptidoglycan/LPS O-acetylase OafA/YrhL